MVLSCLYPHLFNLQYTYSSWPTIFLFELIIHFLFLKANLLFSFSHPSYHLYLCCQLSSQFNWIRGLYHTHKLDIGQN